MNNIDISFAKNFLCIYKIKTEEKGFKEILILINPNTKVELFSLNDNYQVLMTENGRVNNPFEVKNVNINPCSLIVLAK